MRSMAEHFEADWQRYGMDGVYAFRKTCCVTASGSANGCWASMRSGRTRRFAAST